MSYSVSSVSNLYSNIQWILFLIRLKTMGTEKKLSVINVFSKMAAPMKLSHFMLVDLIIYMGNTNGFCQDYISWGRHP